jgi:hypothetical protein
LREYNKLTTDHDKKSKSKTNETISLRNNMQEKHRDENYHLNHYLQSQKHHREDVETNNIMIRLNNKHQSEKNNMDIIKRENKTHITNKTRELEELGEEIQARHK